MKSKKLVCQSDIYDAVSTNCFTKTKQQILEVSVGRT